jgi:hypothetical protein
MATMAAAAEANPGMSITLAASCPAAMPVPAPNTPTRIGRPMASTEPKATKRITIAASSPSPSRAPPPPSCPAKLSPPSSTWSPGVVTLSRSAWTFSEAAVTRSGSRVARCSSA